MKEMEITFREGIIVFREGKRNLEFGSGEPLKIRFSVEPDVGRIVDYEINIEEFMAEFSLSLRCYYYGFAFEISFDGRSTSIEGSREFKFEEYLELEEDEEKEIEYILPGVRIVSRLSNCTIEL